MHLRCFHEQNPWTYDRLIKLEDKWEHEWNSKDSSKKQVSFYSEGDENQGGDDVHEDVNDEPMET